MILFALLLCSIPVLSIVGGKPLTHTLRDLCTELQITYHQREDEQDRFNEDFERQHQRLINVITNSNELSMLLYTQEQDLSFDLSYALKKVSNEYKNFSEDRRPYDRIVNSLNIEIDRYARLLEALRRLPPVMKIIEIEFVPDSLLYHNDSLDMHFASEATSLEKEVIRIAVKDSLSAPFVLDEEGEAYRDTCIQYISELLKMFAENRATVVADSSHYQEAYWRMQEAHEYAESRFKQLQRYFFLDGQTPFMEILANPREYWKKTKADLRKQYDFLDLNGDGIKDSEAVASAQETASDRSDNLISGRGERAVLVVICIIQTLLLVVFWLISLLILRIIRRIRKGKRFIDKKMLPALALVIGTILYFLFFGFFWTGDEYTQLGVRHINTFLWLLIAITGSLLLRVKPEQFRHGMRLYTPTFILALAIIICRITFLPDRLMVMLFPPVLALAVLRQLIVCIRENDKAPKADSALGWISLAIYLISFVFSFFGFTFIALLILTWWYFQLAMLLSIVCIWHLLNLYKQKWLDKRVDAMRNRITYVTGADRETLLFSVTWLYDFVRQVGIPAMALVSLPFCINASLDIFDFDDLFYKIFLNPFIQLFNKEGVETLTISFVNIVCLSVLFFILRYVNRAVHTIWKYMRYNAFLRKYNRTAIRDNEINLSLGNSIISVLMWMIYAVVVVTVLNIPTGSLTLVAGGLSAGIGLALKDILNNFIYGIQLMGGRLRVGDWIECDGVRGRVVAINYQFVQIETVDGTEMSFLNASLFGKNFNNLTRNNSYEFTKIVAGVAYGTDVKRVREVLLDAMEALRTKDRYGREIVEPKYGFNVVVNNMADSAVEIAVKQYVLVAERIGYVDRAKEVIYDALNNAGITIPFPQCDVHLINDEK